MSNQVKNYYFIDTFRIDYKDCMLRRNFKLLSPIKANENYIKPIYFIAVDVENEPKTGKFICAGFSGEYLDENKQVVYFEHYSPDYEDFYNTMDNLKDKEFIYGYYNLSYDEAFLLEAINTSLSLRSGSRVIQHTLYEKYNEKQVWDIQNVSGIEYSLEDWINYLKMEEKYGVKKESLEDLYKRVMNDVKATYILCKFIRDFFQETLGSKLKYTIGSCALELYRKRFLNYTLRREYITDYEYSIEYINQLSYLGKNIEIVKELEKNLIVKEFNIVDIIERACYHGGRNEIIKRGTFSVESYDFNSMYLSVLDEYYPNPESYVYIDNTNINKLNKGWRFYYDKYLCILDCKVFVPKKFNNKAVIIAPVPKKNNETNNIEYPTGTFRDIYTNVELKNAEKYGLQIIEVYSMVYYLQKEKYFYDFQKTVWDSRVNFKSKCANKCKECLGRNKDTCKNYKPNPNYNEPMEIALKKTGNSLIGKFGQHVSTIQYYGKEADMSKELSEEIFNDGKHFEHRLFRGELWISYQSDNYIDSRFAFCVWASFTTAYARIKLLIEAKKYEEEVIYMDTDSIKKIIVKGHHLEDTKELGHMGKEYVIEYNPENKQMGETFYSCKNYGLKTKGIPRTKWKKSVICPYGFFIIHISELNKKNRSTITMDDKINGIKIFEFEKPYKLKESIRRNKNPSSWEKKTKTVTMKDDKRNWIKGEIFYDQQTESIPKHYEI